MSQLYAFRDKQSIVLDWRQGRKFILWLSCGHSGGMAQAHDMVSRRKCHHCGTWNQVVRVEPVK